MKIYHNPKCSKSRETLSLIKKNTSKFEIIETVRTGKVVMARGEAST